MIIYEWHTVPIVGTGFTKDDPKRPDLSLIPGATGSFASAVENGEEMLLLAEVDDGQ